MGIHGVVNRQHLVDCLCDSVGFYLWVVVRLCCGYGPEHKRFFALAENLSPLFLRKTLTNDHILLILYV